MGWSLFGPCDPCCGCSDFPVSAKSCTGTVLPTYPFGSGDITFTARDSGGALLWTCVPPSGGGGCTFTAPGPGNYTISASGADTPSFTVNPASGCNPVIFTYSTKPGSSGNWTCCDCWLPPDIRGHEDSENDIRNCLNCLPSASSVTDRDLTFTYAGSGAYVTPCMSTPCPRPTFTPNVCNKAAEKLTLFCQHTGNTFSTRLLRQLWWITDSAGTFDPTTACVLPVQTAGVVASSGSISWSNDVVVLTGGSITCVPFAATFSLTRTDCTNAIVPACNFESMKISVSGVS